MDKNERGKVVGHDEYGPLYVPTGVELVVLFATLGVVFTAWCVGAYFLINWMLT